MTCCRINRLSALSVLMLGLLVAGCSGEDDSSADAALSPDSAVTGDSGTTGDGPGDTGASDMVAPDAYMFDMGIISVDSFEQGVPSPDSPLPDSAAPAVLHLPHKTDFLGAGCKTHVYGGLSPAQRTACLNQITKRKYTHFYLYVYNENDYGGPSFDYYGKPAAFRARLQEIHAVGLVPVVWLVPDDAKVIHGKSVAAIKSMFDGLIPKIDDLVSSYVLGLELDEYWPGGVKVDALGQHLNTLTSKPIAVHQLKKKWNFGKFGWVDYMMLQYGFGESASTIKQLTKNALSDLNKPVVAGEYALFDENKGVPLGNAAVAAGASGFGNGGTP